LTCTACTRPTTDGIHLCETCTDNLHETINDIPELLEDLADTMAKLDNNGQTLGSPGYHPSAPARLTALELHSELSELLASWTNMLRDYDSRTTPPQDADPQKYLRQSVNEIRKHDFAGDMLDELHNKTTRIRRTIDKPRDIRILGTCWQTIEFNDGNHHECGGKIKADYDQTIAHCSQCHEPYYVSLLLQETERKARGELMPAAEARRFLKQHARVNITAKDMENWIQLGHIPYVLDHVSSIGKGRKLYYPGDVLKVHHRMKDRRRRLIRA
jgi:hypothetical protein